MILQSSEVIPSLSGQNDTQAQLFDQGYTYNQAGFSYNQLGVDYGGVYKFDWDVIPQLVNAAAPIPSIFNYYDIYTNQGDPHGTIPAGQPLAPGFFMYITYPNQLTW